MRALALVLLLAPAARAAETAAFLEVGVGARALGMGGAMTAVADDATALYWNPAGLAKSDKREAAVAHAELPESSRLDFGGYLHPVESGAFGAGFAYLSHGSLEGRDALGRRTADFGASDAVFTAAYARKDEAGSAGLSLKYLRSHIAEAEAQGFAADLGVAKAQELRIGRGLAGFALRHLGPGLKYDGERDALPLTAAAGFAWESPRKVLLAADYEWRPRSGESHGALGAEWAALAGLALRGGWASRGAVGGGSGFDAAKGLTLGVGLRHERARLDYAVKPMGELGRTHRFDLAWRW